MPSRTDYYLMQCAAEIRRNVSKHPAKIKTDDFKITFRKQGAVTPEEEQKKVEYTKQVWLSRMTAKVSIRQDGQEIDTHVPFIVKQQELKKQQAEQRSKQRAQLQENQQRQRKNSVKPELVNPPATTNTDSNDGRDNRQDNGGRILLPRNARKGRGGNQSKG